MYVFVRHDNKTTTKYDGLTEERDDGFRRLVDRSDPKIGRGLLSQRRLCYKQSEELQSPGRAMGDTTVCGR